MCLAYPYKIKLINGKIAIAKVGNSEYEIKTDLVSNLKKNDWILVSNKYAVSKISEQEAKKMIEMIDKTRKAGGRNDC